MLEIENLSAFYGKAQALTDVSLSVSEGAIVSVIGANGAGKSTLFDAVMGLVKTTGKIALSGGDISRASTSEVVRRGAGYAPERANLFPYMSVRDNLLVGAYTARGDIERNLETVYELFPRLRERASQETATQSGGERQMVSLGRALMSSPRILLVDEPTIGLAPKVCDEIAEALKQLNDLGVTIVIAEQNVNFALRLASQIHVLEGGRIRRSGSADELAADKDLEEAYFGRH
ncbi:MAG: ABC transporter ATP-binding protein [Pseudomonadota bacterium]